MSKIIKCKCDQCGKEMKKDTFGTIVDNGVKEHCSTECWKAAEHDTRMNIMFDRMIAVGQKMFGSENTMPILADHFEAYLGEAAHSTDDWMLEWENVSEADFIMALLKDFFLSIEDEIKSMEPCSAWWKSDDKRPYHPVLSQKPPKCTCPDPATLPEKDMDGSDFVQEPCDWCKEQHNITNETEYYYDKMSK